MTTPPAAATEATAHARRSPLPQLPAPSSTMAARASAGQAMIAADAPSAASVRFDDVICPICFDMMSFPVTLPCGHNFDRGCLLSAWKNRVTREDEDEEAPDHDALVRQRKRASCPLCRHAPGVLQMQDLQVNKLLQKFITALDPAEREAVASSDKEMALYTGAVSNSSAAGSARSMQTMWSVLYVYLASITDPPGFVLAVLLLLGLLMIAANPQQLFTNSATLPMLFTTMDGLFSLLTTWIHELSGVFDEFSPWLQLFSFVL